MSGSIYTSLTFTAPPMERFLRNAQSLGGCWEWYGYRNKDGYGLTKANGRTALAHRVAYRLSIGVILEGEKVCHACDNPICCRPDHFFLGSQKDNVDDCIAKGRFVIGEKNGGAKLTDILARQIRTDTRTQVEIAAAFGISQSLVSAIKTGLRWNHVPS